jgi:hypothetical protein
LSYFYLLPFELRCWKIKDERHESDFALPQTCGSAQIEKKFQQAYRAGRVSGWNLDFPLNCLILLPMTQPRPLTHDEKKASEAAFSGLPQDANWTDAAKSVYEGIIHALGQDPSGLEASDEAAIPALIEEPDGSSPKNIVEFPTSDSVPPQEIPPELKQLTIRLRREAVESGILKDVTPLAQSLGLDFCVAVTNPFWEQYITSSPDFTEERIHSRLRDTLVAVRLRLASLKEAIPLVDVPVLLEFDPEPTPQLCLTFALFHKDPVDGNCLLLIHPGEVFATRQSFENN